MSIKPAQQEKKPLSKAALRRLYGHTEFHYLKTCSHDVKRRGMCSFCKMIDREATQYLREESARKELQRLHGFFRRAEMRYGLIRDWSQNQLYKHKELLQTHSAEIVLCSGLGDCVGHFGSNLNNALDDVALNLRKRVRVLEVGNFAAILIQAKIRGHLARKKMRHYLLGRFQYFAANPRRKAYFFDHEKGNRWMTPPALIKNERPVSPSTMSRRLRAENRVCEQHVIQYERACKRDESYLHDKRGGLWRVFEEDTKMLRQMIVFRDVVYSVMSALSAKRREDGERPTNRKSILPLGGPKGLHPSESQPPSMTSATETNNGLSDDADEPRKVAVVKRKTNRYKRGESVGGGLSMAKSGADGRSNDDTKQGLFDYSKNLTDIKPNSSAFPYWFSFSNPAPPTRQIYLTLAIQTPPLPQEVIVELTAEELEAKLKAESASKVVITAEVLESKSTTAAKKKPEDSEEPEEDKVISEEEEERLEKRKNPNSLTLNERFLFLDKRIWSQMVCFDAEDILRKISLSEDVHPAISSGVGIAEDTHRVWCGDVEPGGDIPGCKVRALKGIGDTDSESSIQYSPTDTESEGDDSEPSNRKNSTVATGNKAGGQDEERGNEGSIIPIQLQIHPLYMHREPSNMFRLFFIEGKLRAVCHTSPWAYYSDMYTYRASVVKALAMYSTSSACITLLQSIMEKSADPSKTNENARLRILPNLSRMGSSRRNLTAGSSKNLLASKIKGSCMSIRLPDEKVLFDGPPALTGSVLTSKEYKKIEQKYGFLKKMFSWKKYKRQTARHVDLDSHHTEVTLSAAELLRQESVCTQSGDDVDRRVAIMPPPQELMGSTVYKLCCGDVPQCTLSQSAKQKLVDYNGANGYRALLKKNTNTGETMMNHCISLPATDEHSEGLESEVTPHPVFDLIVLEVFLKDTRAEEEEALRKLEEEANIPRLSKSGAMSDQGNRRTSYQHNGRLPPMTEKKTKKHVEVKTPIIDLVVELHHVVGTFSTFAERAPASIDTGMFEWADMKTFGSPPVVEEIEKTEIPLEEMTAFQISQEEKRRNAVPEWIPLAKCPGSGIYSYNVSMTTARTQQAAPDDTSMIEFRMLGKRPSREYLQAAVPLKIKKWLGMKY